MTKPLILKNVTLNDEVENFVKELYTIVDVKDLTDEQAEQIEVLLTNGTGVARKDLLDRLPNLKLIDDFGVGYDGIDIDECQKRGITLCNTPDVLTDDVADLALALMLTCSRRLVCAHNYVVAGKWANNEPFPLGQQVSKKRVGIVGMGRIGRAVAQRCLGFNMEISYYSRHAQEDFKRYESLVNLARNNDYLVVCAASTPENRGLINAQVLEALGSKGILINIARGALVDEKALVTALHNKVIGGAALDVFEQEPHVPQELWELDNVILSPHIASATQETRHAMAELVINNLKAFREGKPYLTALDY